MRIRDVLRIADEDLNVSVDSWKVPQEGYPNDYAQIPMRDLERLVIDADMWARNSYKIPIESE